MDKLQIFICENFYPEYQAALQKEEINDIKLHVYPTLCNHKGRKNEVKEILSQADAGNSILICNKSCDALKLMDEDKSVVSITGNYCFTHLTCDEFLDYLISQRSYIVSLGWLKQWKNHLADMGFDKDTARSYFQETSKQIVFLDAKIDDQAEGLLEELSSNLGLPYLIVPIKLETIGLMLKSRLYEWRLHNQNIENSGVINELRSRSADYSAVFDMLGEISSLTSKRDVIGKVKDLFMMVFGAQKFRFWREHSEFMPIEIREFKLKHANYAMLKSENRLCIKVSWDDQPYGILDASEFLFPEYTERYLNLVLDITKFLGLVLHNNEQYERIVEQNSLLEKLPEQVPGVIYQYRYHPDGRNYFPYASSAICDIYEVSPEEVKEDALKVLSRLHSDDYNDVMEGIIESLKTLEIWEAEYRVILPKKGERWVSGIAKPEKMEDGSVLWNGYITDITERKHVEKKLAEHTTELEIRGLELDALNRMLLQELDSARRVHKRLLNLSMPPVKGISFAANCTPATYIGGDFYQVIGKDNKLIVYISDITGHGLDGTMFSLFVKNTIESYVELTPAVDLTTELILSYLDSQVRKGSYPSEYAVAIFLMVIDVPSKVATYAAAGMQNAPVLVNSEGKIELLVSKGLPISLDVPREVMDFTEEKLILPDDSFLFLSTDGLYEQLDGAAEMYEQRLMTLLPNCTGLSEVAIMDNVLSDFEEFLGDQEQADDVAFVILSTGRTSQYSMPSSFDSLDQVTDAVMQYYRYDPGCEDIAMAVHELVVNAIEHGNKLDKNKSVRIQFSPKGVVVEDEGDGFDWRSRVERELSLTGDSERGRGIAMVQMLVGDLVYNQKGTRVSLIIRPC